ncbi:MAG: lasso peptide biosynthesis B2 protein [Bacteroidota bacterium]|nr:lasso peptide biosynthesis B2 protein [Bacteroidota bacterium]
MNYFFKYLKLKNPDRRLLHEAIVFLFYEKFRVHTLPFKKLVGSREQDEYSDSLNDMVLRRIRLAIRRANKLAWWSNVCLVKSLAARRMLNRRRISSSFHLGLRFENKNKLAAHAWLISGDMEITPKGRERLKEIICF